MKFLNRDTYLNFSIFLLSTDIPFHNISLRPYFFIPEKEYSQSRESVQQYLIWYFLSFFPSTLK